LASVVGGLLILAFSGWRLIRGRPLIGGVFLFVLIAMFIPRQIRHARSLATGKPRLSEAIGESLNMVPRGPIVVSDPHSFLKLWHYAPSDVKNRLYYLTNPEAQIKHLGSDTSDRSLAGLSALFSLPVREYQSFVDSHHHFHTYGRQGWLVPQLLEDGARLTMKQSYRRATRAYDLLLGVWFEHPGDDRAR
jgi:hypothetical protein